MRPELSGKPLVFVVGAFAHGKVRACVGWGCVVPARLLVWALAPSPTAGIALRPGNALQLCSRSCSHCTSLMHFAPPTCATDDACLVTILLLPCSTGWSACCPLHERCRLTTATWTHDSSHCVAALL